MGWASVFITRLQAGETVSFRPRGSSMMPRIKSGALCTVSPVDVATLAKGDVVLCRVGGAEYLHKITAIDGCRFQIGNNHGHINGWVAEAAIFGKLVRVEP